MLQTEYIRNLNCNYERIFLEKTPEENRYQYCIVGRGGIKGLLPCSLRYINGNAYLYYDISSTQNVFSLYAGRKLNREWLKDFVWSLQQLQTELARFLLDDSNVIWFPQQIYQDLEKNLFYYIYIPYYEGNSGFGELVEYLVEHIDYEDNALVECVYKMYEQYGLSGSVYLQNQIFEDIRILDEKPVLDTGKWEEASELREAETRCGEQSADTGIRVPEEGEEESETNTRQLLNKKEGRKGIFYLLDGKRKKQKEEREELLKRTSELMSASAVSEDTVYEAADWGKTVYYAQDEEKPLPHGLADEKGRTLLEIRREIVILGKKKEEVDLALEDGSVSRVHARILRDREEFYLEDLNSTNGTFKNGLRLQPYEKRKLERGDEIRLGRVMLTFR